MIDAPKKRLFVAIGLPREVQQKLEEMQTQLKRFARDAKWVKVAGIHLTLKFLGYVEPSRIQTIYETLRPIAFATSSIPIEVFGCGFFPNPQRPNVLWTGVRAKELAPLQQHVEDAMATLGFEKEKRPFSPHLTLARFRDPRGWLPLVQETQKWMEVSFGAFVASGFSLYESILHRQGAEYHTVETFRLK